jgi:amphi-Trp domain-containing protein
MSVGKRKQKRTMSRDEAARLFATLGSAFSGTDEVTIDVDGETVTLGSPSEIDVELEVKSSHRKSELELEMKWSHAAAEA